MRILGRSLLFLLLILLGIIVQTHKWPVFDFMGLRADSLMLDQAHPSPTYILDNKKWLNFAVSQHVNNITVLSHASFPDGQLSPDDAVWLYAIEYQLVDNNNNVLEHRSYHHRTRITKYYNETTDKELSRSFYLDDSIIPSDSSFLPVNTEHLKNVAILRMRLASHSSELNDVAVRVYEPSLVSTHKIGAAWQRLSYPQKTFLARGSIYGPSLMQPDEKHNLLLNRVLPTGPQGVEGQDYQVRTIYYLRDTVDELVEQTNQINSPSGLLVDQWLHGIIEIPENGLRLKIMVDLLDKSQIIRDSSIQLKLYQDSMTEVKSYHLVLNNGNGVIEQDFPAGVIEIISPVAASVKAYQSPNNLKKELAIEPFYLRTYITQPQSPVEFAIDHVANSNTPMRIDIRSFDPQAISADHRAKTIRYEIANAKDEVIKHGELHIDNISSTYDYVSGDTRNYHLTEATRRFFNLPDKATKIRFWSEQPVLIAAYTRPMKFLRRIRVPEHYYVSTENNAVSKQPSWFRIRPLHENRLLNEKRATLLRVQRRPPQRNQTILDGDYQWQSYQPTGNWRARHLLMPRENKNPLRRSGLNILYSPLTNNQVNNVKFIGRPGIEHVRPSLLFFSDSQQPFTASVEIDGQSIVQRDFTTSRGSLKLPQLTVGPHSIRINSPHSLQWYVNYSDSTLAVHIKRLVQRLPARGLHFEYEKTQSHEVISAKLFLPYNNKQRTTLKLVIEDSEPRGIGPFKQWSLMKREYDVRPSNEQRIAVLNTKSSYVGPAQSMYIALGDDLPVGRYKIHVKTAQHSDAYILFYRISTDELEHRNFFNEYFAGL